MDHILQTLHDQELALMQALQHRQGRLWAEGPGRTGAAGGGGRAEVDGADVEGAGLGAADVDGASDILALDFWVPQKVTEG